MNKKKKNLQERLKPGPYLTVYNKDYIKKERYEVRSREKYIHKQEFIDPIREGFKHYLKLSETDVKPPRENADKFLEKVLEKKPKIRTIYFQNPLDHIAIRGEQLLTGKTEYQVDYCDIEADIKRKLLQANKAKLTLPDDWEIPVTTQKTDYRPPLLLCANAMDPPLVIKQPDNLGSNEQVNQILNVTTGDSEYNCTIGELGGFIVSREMHGKIQKTKISL